MEFISNFWPAYVPIGIVLVAAIIELVIDAGKRERSRPVPQSARIRSWERDHS
jgi:hypothetical protein